MILIIKNESMRNIINIILLSPVLIYVVLLLINSELLTKKELVNIFWIWNIEIPLIALISVFFVAYIFLMYFSGKFSSFFISSKNKSLEEEKIQLKAKLSEQIPEIEKRMNEKFSKVLEDFKEVGNKNLELHKKETSKTL
jgi:uncharacterized integral membrane protein